MIVYIITNCPRGVKDFERSFWYHNKICESYKFHNNFKDQQLRSDLMKLALPWGLDVCCA